MASVATQPHAGSPTQAVTETFLDLTLGSSGAVPATSTWKHGLKVVASVVRNSAGKYTITFKESWPAFLGVKVTPINTAFATTKALEWGVLSEAVASTTPTVVIQFYSDTTRAAADLPDNTRVIFHFTFKNIK
jgi:hypothetical protein